MSYNYLVSIHEKVFFFLCKSRCSGKGRLYTNTIVKLFNKYVDNSISGAFLYVESQIKLVFNIH